MLYVWDSLLSEPLTFNGIVAFNNPREAYIAIDNYLLNTSDTVRDWDYFDIYVGVVEHNAKADLDKTYDDLLLEHYLR